MSDDEEKPVKIPKITEDHAKKVLGVVDKGLTQHLGEPIPGKMCVEAAVCYAFGWAHNDQPKCVHQMIRDIKIHINDDYCFYNDRQRAKALRRLAIAQLGTQKLNQRKFVEKLLIKSLEMEKKASKRNTTIPKTVKSCMSYIQRIDEESYDCIDINVHEFQKLYNQERYGACSDLIINFLEGFFDVIGDNGRGSYTTRKEEGAFIVCEGLVEVLKEITTPGSGFLYLAPPKPYRKAKGA